MSEDALLKKLRFQCKEDFARAHLRIVPVANSRRIVNTIEGYGQDNSACTYAALRSIMGSKPYYTSVFIGFDSEEGEQNSYYSANGGFLEEIIDEVIGRLGKPKRINGYTFIDDQLRRKIYKKSLCISGDVDIGASHLEESDQAKEIDIFNIGIIGHGTEINIKKGVTGGYRASTLEMDKYIELANRSIFQIKQGAHSADFNDDGETQADYFAKRGVPVCEIGPCGDSLHGLNEGFNIGDIYSTFVLYKDFFNRRKK